MRKIILIILLTSSGICLKAQTNLDSLYAVWQDQNQSDSIRVAAYKDYIWNGFLYSQPDTAFILAEELLAYGLDKNYLQAQALGYNIQGVSWYMRGDYPKALDYFTQSLKIKEQIGDQMGIAASLNNIGLIYVNQGDYPKALDYYSRSLKIEEQIGNQKGISLSLNNIGIIYNNQGDYPKALDYYTQSLKIKEQIGDQKGVAASLNNIGLIYQYQGNYPKALDYYTQSLKIKEQIGDQLGIAPSLHNIGIVYQNQGDYPKALDYFTQSLKIKEQIGDQKGIAQSLNNIGIVYQKQGDYSQALDYCQRSYELALAVGALELQKSGCTSLYDIYKAMGNGSKALEYHELLNVINDSLHAAETAKKLQQMEFQKVMFLDSIAKAEEARLVQEAHREEVRQKNRTKNVFLVSGVILIFVSLGLWRGLHFVRRSRKQIAHEKERSDNLLLNILPSEIAEELKEKGRADARSFDMVSILFSDFKGFTQISEKLSAEELVGEINACFKIFDAICEKYEIEKIKTIGDSYMAAGGIPVPTDDSVKNTVLAALEMSAFMINRRLEQEAKGGISFEMRVGIHTGPVVAGIVGVTKFQYDIWGDTVNTASRMESSGEVGRVNISRSVYDQVKEDPIFKFQPRGKVQTKGKGVIEMWFVEKA
jgi:adenylate cyclase